MGQLKNKYNPLLEKGIQKIINTDLLYFDATVGTGGDYPATNGIKLALEDGKRNLKLISDVTETTNWNFSGGRLYINGKSNNGNYKITFVNTSISDNLGIVKKLQFENVDIEINNTGNFLNAIYTSSFNMRNSSIKWLRSGGNFNSTGISGIVLNWENTTVNFYNGSTDLFITGLLENCTINGGGTSCKSSFRSANGNLIVSKCIFTGTFYDSVDAGERISVFQAYSPKIKLSNCINEATAFSIINAKEIVNCSGNVIKIEGYLNGPINQLPTVINSNISIRLDEVYRRYSGTLNAFNSNVDIIDIRANDNSVFGNLKMQYGTLNWNRSIVYGDTIGEISLENVKILGGSILKNTHTTIEKLTLEKCTIPNIINIVFDKTRILNCDFGEGLVISGSNCNINNNILENGTITVTAIADKTTLMGNRTLTSIIDNGTNTQLIANNLI